MDRNGEWQGREAIKALKKTLKKVLTLNGGLGKI